MSVSAMLAIAYAWTNHDKQNTYHLMPAAFADNWGWNTTDPTEHEPALQATKQMAEFLNMIVDWKKSWLWSTHKQHLPMLKGQSKKQPHMNMFPK